MVPAIPDIIRNGKYHGREPIAPKHKRSDDIVAFHYFDGFVQLGDKTVEAGVTVGEDSRGNLFYNINHDGQALWAKRKDSKVIPGDARGKEPYSVAPSRLEARLQSTEQNVDEDSGGVNIAVLGRAPRSFNTHTADSLRAAMEGAFPGVASALERGGRMEVISRADVSGNLQAPRSEVASELATLAAEARDGVTENRTVEIGPVTAEQAREVQDNTRVDVSGFTHSADFYAIRHVFKEHGNQESEQS